MNKLDRTNWPRERLRRCLNRRNKRKLRGKDKNCSKNNNKKKRNKDRENRRRLISKSSSKRRKS